MGFLAPNNTRKILYGCHLIRCPLTVSSHTAGRHYATISSPPSVAASQLEEKIQNVGNSNGDSNRNNSSICSSSPTTTSMGGKIRQQRSLSGYYLDILKTPSPYTGYAPTSRPISGPETDTAEKAAHGEIISNAKAERAKAVREKMSIVFGSRLASPGYRSSRYHPESAPPESTWKTINGVAIPPRPQEPDNCCMSGCAHCVYDDYQEDVENWASKLAEARAKIEAARGKDGAPKKPGVADGSLSMDDDGGGSETNWTMPSSSDDLFAEIPVGIREFMKTEKKLKQRKQIHQKEAEAEAAAAA